MLVGCRICLVLAPARRQADFSAEIQHHVLARVAWSLYGTRSPHAWRQLLRTTWCCVPDGCHAVAAVLRRETVGAIVTETLVQSVPLVSCHSWGVDGVCRQCAMIHLSGLCH